MRYPRNVPDEAIYQALVDLMRDRYHTDSLVNVSAEDFQSHITELTHDYDATPDAEFIWGHDQDFGTFEIEGMMHIRHLLHIAFYMSRFDLSLEDFDGKDILEIGAWTGGGSLLFAAMGGNVTAVEIDRKYARAIEYMARAFEIDHRLAVKGCSLYDLNFPLYHDCFDIVQIAAVLYHVTDPFLALRICFNALRPGGIILLEDAGVTQGCDYKGISVYRHSVCPIEKQRWNFFKFSPVMLERLISNVGFEDIRVAHARQKGVRYYAIGTKKTQKGIPRWGLSAPQTR